MRKRTTAWTRLVLITMPVILLACAKRTEEGTSTDNTIPVTINISPTYQPPVFTDPERLEKIKSTFPEVDAIFRRHAEENNYPGLVYGIVVDDSLVFSGATGLVNLDTGEPVTAESGFHIASMTKSFTAMAILKLRDERKLSLLDPVAKYIPGFAGQEYLSRDAPLVTIQNLMTMTSGFPEDNPWADRQLEDSDQEFMELISGGLSFSNIPSYQYEYSNLGYAMLGTIINKVAGMPYQRYITEEIFLPLGMTNTYWEYEEVPDNLLAQGYRWEEEQWKEEPMLHTGAFGAIGGMITSLNDFSKYVAFHLSAWPPRSDPETGPVKRSTVREMQVPTMPRLYAGATDAEGEPCPILSGYGYGLGIRKDCEGLTRVSHSGGLPGYGCEYRFFPDYGIGIISFSNRTYASTGQANAEAMQVILEKSDIEPRAIPASPILKKRTEQVRALLNTWDEQLGEEILADNFYLDQSRKLRMKNAREVLEAAGVITAVDPLRPQNQLRGTFLMHGEQKDVQVFFSLSPEKEPKVQALYLWNVEPGTD